MEQSVQYLLNEQIGFDLQKVQILDQITEMMYSKQMNNQQNIHMANQVLSQLKQQESFWTSTQFILENSQSNNTKFLCLMILDEVIKTRWKIFPQNVKDNTKKYVMDQIITLGVNTQLPKDLDKLLNKTNQIIVQILKHEWQSSWQSFIQEVCSASINNNQLCGNTFNILKMLSEEIFEHSKNEMTSKQISNLKNQMYTDFTQIFELCKQKAFMFIQNPQNMKLSLIKNCLQVLNTYISWIPLQYVFSQELIESILLPLLQHEKLRRYSLQCFYEISIIDISKFQIQEKQQLQQRLLFIFEQILQKTQNELLQGIVNIQSERVKIEENDSTKLDKIDTIIRQLSLIFSGFISTHFEWFQSHLDMKYLSGLSYLVQFTEVKEDQIFKICVEFWHSFLQKVVQSQQQQMNNDNSRLLNLDGQMSQNQQLNKMIYPQVYQLLINVLIMRMAKPTEVLIIIDDTGNPTREIMENTENNYLFELLRDILQTLCKLDWDNVRSIAMHKIDKQMEGSEWSFDNINSICWAVGAISGHMPTQDEEKFFLIKVIKNLLVLVEKKKGKENKAVVASNIMYVVGQYPLFLQQNFNFLKTVVKKLFEFMHEVFPGIMDMACNTFLRIAQICKQEFVKKQDQDDEPYIYQLIRQIPEETRQLDNQQKLIFYEALGHIVNNESDFQNQNVQMVNITEGLTKQFLQILNDIDNDYTTLKIEDVLEFLQFFFRVYERLAFSIGDHFGNIIIQNQEIMINLYKCCSNIIKQDYQNVGPQVMNYSYIKKIRRIKKDIIQIYESYLTKSSDQNINNLTSNFCPAMLALLQDYQNSIDASKEMEVLRLFSKMVDKLAPHIQNAMTTIIEIVLTSNNMITQDFNSYPDHRAYFYQFLNSVTNHSFNSLFQLNQDLFRTFINFILWSVKHELYNIYDIGLDILFIVLKNVNQNYEVLNMFYQIYYMSLMKDILEVSIDGKHKNGLKKQSQILQLMFSVVQDGQFVNNIDQSSPNKEFIYNQLVSMLTSAFTNINAQQTEYFIQQLFKQCVCKANDGSLDYKPFLKVLRDYLIKLSQFSDDLEILYEQEQSQNQ